MTTAVAVPFLLTTVTFTRAFRSATVLSCGRILVSGPTVTVCAGLPFVGLIVSVVVPLLPVDTAEIVPTT